MKRLKSVVAILFLCTLVAVAQNRPNISRVIHNGTRTLTTGEKLDVVLLGDAGCTARFEILGAIRGVSMTEVQPGRYEARYTIPPGLEVDRGIVIGYLSRGGAEAALESSQPITIKMGAAKPKISTSPGDGQRTKSTQPNVTVTFPSPVNPSGFRFFLDNIDFSRQIRFTDGNKKMTWKPGYELSKTKHQAELSGADSNGNRVSHKWNFEVGGGGQKGERFVQQFLPKKDSEINDARPTIGAVFKRKLQNSRIMVDNRDFTISARRTAQQIVWTPNYDLSPGVHQVKVIGFTEKGKEITRNWKFTIGQGQSIKSVSFSPQKVRVGQKLTVKAEAPKGSTVTFDLGNKKRGIVLKDSNNSGVYQAVYTPVAGDAGQHSILCRVRLANGRSLTKAANGQVVIEASALVVDNIQNGISVPVNFNVIGSGQPGSQITVVAEYTKADILGALTGQTKRRTYTTNVGPSRRFDVPVQLDLGNGAQFRLKVSDNMGSEPLIYTLVHKK
jgi:hypothetical protein